MPPRTSARALLLRAAGALRRTGAALARWARAAGRGAGEGPRAAPQGGEGDGAFLSQVRETLLEISGGPDQAPPQPDQAPPQPAPPAPQSGLLRAGWRRLATLVGRARRHEDLVLALALLAGIAVMILHWVR